MIDFTRLNEAILPRFKNGINEFRGEQTQLFADVIDGIVSIQSGQILIGEEGLGITLFHEFEDGYEHLDKQFITEQLKSLLFPRCFKTFFSFKEKGSRNFLCMQTAVLLPSVFVEVSKLNTNIAKEIIKDCLDDFVGYSPLWLGIQKEIDYVSRCAKPLASGEKFYYPDTQKAAILRFLSSDKGIEDIDPNDINALLGFD